MGSEKEIDINFIVAHSHEARPFIDHYRLSKANQHTAFSVFENKHVRLIISGQGKLNASAATAYMGGINHSQTCPNLWMNVGIAGHPKYPIGSVWRVNKITDQQSGRNYYPLAVQSLKHTRTKYTQSPVDEINKQNIVKGAALMTVETATSTYPQVCLYDMEACGYFQTALRFSSLEKIACFKVVSDNHAQPSLTIDKKNIAQMMEPATALIDQYLHHLISIININKPRQDIDLKHIKSTYSQKEIIRELVESLTVHGISYSDELTESVNARQLINSLKQKLKSTELLV